MIAQTHRDFNRDAGPLLSVWLHLRGRVQKLREDTEFTTFPSLRVMAAPWLPEPGDVELYMYAKQLTCTFFLI